MGVYEGKPTKDGRRWYFRTYKKDIYGNNKQFESQKYATKKEAENEERLFKLKKNNPYKKQFGLVAMDYFKELYTKRKESTVVTYEHEYNNHIKPYFEQKDINDINVPLIREWHLELLKKGFKLKYCQKIHIELANILDFAVKNYGLETNYAKVLGNFEKVNDEIQEDKEKLKYLTYDQFQKFISVIDDELYFTLFNFFYYTGMRLGEVQALSWTDVDFKNNEIIVNKTLSTKTIKEEYKLTSTKNNLNRKVRMSNTLTEIMEKYHESMKKYADYNDNWFVFGCSRFLPSTTLKRYLKKYFDLANFTEEERITIHGFRHSHVSLLINEYIRTSKEKNMKIDTTKFFLMMSNRMGHEIQTMQKVYMHLFPNVQDEIVDLLDSL